MKKLTKITFDCYPQFKDQNIELIETYSFVKKFLHWNFLDENGKENGTRGNWVRLTFEAN